MEDIDLLPFIFEPDDEGQRVFLEGFIIHKQKLSDVDKFHISYPEYDYLCSVQQGIQDHLTELCISSSDTNNLEYFLNLMTDVKSLSALGRNHNPQLNQ